MDTNAMLQDAGLLDTSGAPTTSANFGAKSEPSTDALDWQAMGLEPNDESVFNAPSKVEATPVVQEAASQVPAAGATTFDPNPAARPQITPQQAHVMGEQTINQQLQEALLHGLSLRDAEGKALYTADELLAKFAPVQQQMMSQLQADVVKHQMAPYAQRMVAEDIAKRHGVKVDDILDGSSPEVMEDRAKTLVRLQRDQKFDARAASRKDVAEGSRGISSGMSQAYEKLSPSQKIKYGLLRGDS